jgi:hypothetical protein
MYMGLNNLFINININKSILLVYFYIKIVNKRL